MVQSGTNTNSTINPAGEPRIIESREPVASYTRETFMRDLGKVSKKAKSTPKK